LSRSSANSIVASEAPVETPGDVVHIARQ